MYKHHHSASTKSSGKALHCWITFEVCTLLRCIVLPLAYLALCTLQYNSPPLAMLQTKIDLHFSQLGLPALIFDHHHSGLFLMQKFNRANFPPSPTSSYLYHKAFNTNISSHFLVIINSLKYCTSSSWRDRSGRS